MSSPKSRLDQVIASVPQNATAARVVSRGEHYEPEIDYRGCWHSPVPPTMVAIHTLHIEARALAARVIGKRFGRLTVIGFAAPIPGYRARWVVRCSCGQYELRSPRFFKKFRRNLDGWCCQCEHLKKIRYQYDILGSRPVSDFAHPILPPVTEIRPAVEGPGNGSHKPGTPAGDPKANPLTRGAPAVLGRRADLRREHKSAELGATIADVWPGARP